MTARISERLIAMQPLWGAWNIEELIGEGSYGKVYRIRRREPAFEIEQESALKWICLPQREDDLNRLRAEGMSDEDIRAYYDGLILTLKNEIRLMISLSGNSHIVNYADHAIVERRGEIGWDILIRMEYLTPLDAHILNAPFSERDAALLGFDICEALKLCAQHRILHRDVKPDNIFLSRDGNFKLGDFGVSRVLEETASQLSTKGAPMYMAPEIYTRGEVDFSADTYSLGLVLYRLLNHNRMPFLPLKDLPTHYDREAALTRRLRGDEIPPPAEGCRELKRIVLKACAYRRAQRFASAKEMGEALEALLKKDRLSDQDLMADMPRANRIDSQRSPLSPPAAPPPGQAGRAPVQRPAEPPAAGPPADRTVWLPDGPGEPFEPVPGEGKTEWLPDGPAEPDREGTRFEARAVNFDGAAPPAAGPNERPAGPERAADRPDGKPWRRYGVLGAAAALIAAAIAFFALGAPEKPGPAAFNASSQSPAAPSAPAESPAAASEIPAAASESSAAPSAPAENPAAASGAGAAGLWRFSSGGFETEMTLGEGGALDIASTKDEGGAQPTVRHSGSYQLEGRALHLTIDGFTVTGYFTSGFDAVTISMDGRNITFHRGR